MLLVLFSLQRFAFFFPLMFSVCIPVSMQGIRYNSALVELLVFVDFEQITEPQSTILVSSVREYPKR